MDNQLHPAAFVEEALGDDRVLRGDIPQYRAALQDVFDRLLGGGIVESAFLLKPPDGFRNRGLAGRNPDGRSVTQAIADFFAQAGYMRRKLLSARRSLAAPEGNTGRSAVSIFHQHAPRLALHATDAPRGVAQQHDVAVCVREILWIVPATGRPRRSAGGRSRSRRSGRPWQGDTWQDP